MTRILPIGVLLAALCSLTLSAALVSAQQTVVTGRVFDAATQAPLPSATIQIADSFIGTVANSDGRFRIEVPGFPATLTIRFVGYTSASRVLESRPPGPLRVELTPAPYQLSEIVVSAEDPAVGIMRRVIARKIERRSRLETLRAEAYNRFTISNDTGIVSIAEGLSQFVWDRDRGSREVVTATRKTENLAFSEFLPVALLITNLYDDNIDVMDHDLMGVTHPDAIGYYRFRLEGTHRQDGRDVYTISVKTRSKLSSGFVGVITVADQDDAMLSVDLRPNESFLFPPPLQRVGVTFSQQYLPYGDDFWFPADFRSKMNIKVGIPGILVFPEILINQFSRLSDYEVNVSLPDSLFESKRRVSVDSVSVKDDALLDQPGRAVPLSELEEVAYAEIDSTETMEKAFAPGGLFGRAARLQMSAEEQSEAGAGGGRGTLGSLDFRPDLGYNRVEGFSPALSVSMGGDFRVSGRFGRSFGLEENVYGFGARLRLNGYRLEGGWDRRLRPTYESWTHSRFENSVAFVLGAQDYFDYYRSERITAELRIPGSRTLPEVTVGIIRDDASQVPMTTDWRLLNDEPVGANPGIRASRTGAFRLTAELGEEPDPFGVAGSNWIGGLLEVAQTGFLGSDHNYVRGRLRATLTIPTFYRRRFLPQDLQLHLNVGVSTGEVPRHRLWTVDGSNRTSKPGGLRTLAGRPLVGDRTAFLGWEHNFRTVPFERLGLRAAARKNLGIIVYGGHGRSWLRDENRPPVSAGLFPDSWTPLVSDAWHHEVGVSLNGLFGWIRLDLTRRLDEPEWALGLGIAKLF